MTLSVEDAAKQLGMGVHEVTSVEQVDGGHLVVTHDGYPTLIRDDGSLEFGYGRDPAQPAPTAETPVETAPATQTPAYVFDLIDAWATGADLDFGGHPVPDDVRARLAQVAADVAPTGEDTGAFRLTERNDAGVPSGTTDEVLAWVNEDPAGRAAAALAVEQGRDKPRKGLVEALEKLTG